MLNQMTKKECNLSRTPIKIRFQKTAHGRWFSLLENWKLKVES